MEKVQITSFYNLQVRTAVSERKKKINSHSANFEKFKAMNGWKISLT